MSDSEQATLLQNPGVTEDALADIIASKMKASDEPDKDDETDELDGDDDESTDVEDSDDEAEDQDGDDDTTDADDDSLAAFLGVSEDAIEYDDEGNVVFNAIVDDKTVQVSFNDLVKSYQLEQHVNGKSMELSDKAKAFEEESSKAMQQINAQLQESTQILDVVSNQLIGDYQSINWEELKAQDPSLYVQQKEAFAQQARRIQQAKGEVEKKATEAQQQQQEQMVKQFQEQVEEQRKLMLINNPTWRDESTFKKDTDELKVFLKSQYGFSEEEVNTVIDAKVVSIIQDAFQFRKGKKVAEKKLQKKVPKFRKSGSRRDTANANKKATQRRRAALKKSGNQEDLTAVLRDRM